MIEWIVSSSLLILFVLVIRQVFKGRISLRMQYALWFLVMLRLIIPGHIGNSQISFANAAESGQSYIQHFVEPVIVSYQRQFEPAHHYENSPSAVYTDNKETPVSGVNTADMLELVWIGGALTMAMFIYISNLRFYLRLRRSRKLIGYEEKLPVYQCSWLETPCLFGFRRPAIYVVASENEKELSHIICHEYGHYLHRDHIWSMLRTVCLVLHWYNPLVWAAAMLSRRDGELACDEAVVRYLGVQERVEYGRTLLHMTLQGREPVFNMGTTMKGSGKSIAQRIHYIAHRPQTKLYAMLSLLLVALLAAGCSFIGAESGEALPEVTPIVTAVPEKEEAVILDKVVYDLTMEEGNSKRHTESFFNENGDVEFLFDFKTPTLPEEMPVLDSVIRELRVDDAKSVAQAAFGTSQLYSVSTHTYKDKEELLLSREEIENSIEFAKALKSDEELMDSVYGSDSLHTSLGQLEVDRILSRYDNPEYLSTAIWEKDREPVNWEFVPDEKSVWEDSFVIEGGFRMNGISYDFRAFNGYNAPDMDYAYQVTIAPVWDGLMAMNDERSNYEHSGAEAPTDEQFIAAQTEAIRILEEMDPGRWKLSYCIGEQQYAGRYIIEIYAQPVFEGFPLIRQDVFPWIQTQEDIRFEFGVDGVLLRMEYQDPMLINKISTPENCLDFQTLVDYAKDYFRNGSIEQYDYWINGSSGYHEGVSSKVYISEVQQGWIRVPEEGEEMGFTLEPVISFCGSFQSFDENGEETSRSKAMNRHQNVLLNLSVLDGSVVLYQTDFAGVNGLSRK